MLSVIMLNVIMLSVVAPMYVDAQLRIALKSSFTSGDKHGTNCK
jgi:hypothetical protein